VKIVIDANAVCHREKHTMKNLSWDEKKVGIIFGFFLRLIWLAKKFGTTQFIFCWDSKTSKRELFYPVYKSNRKDKTEEQKELDEVSYPQFDDLRIRILPNLGFKNNFMYPGYESDDIIAEIVQNNPSEEFIIISSDSDLYQLLEKSRVKIYDLSKKVLFTEEAFEAAYGIKPNDWPVVKAMAGCSSDNIKGFEGIGEKTVLKLLSGSLKKTHKLYKLIDSPEGLRMYQRNLILVLLPYAKTPHSKLRYDRLLFKEFTFMCETYGFKSFLYKHSIMEWKERFNLK